VDKQEGKWLKHIIPSQLIILARVQDMVLDMARVQVLDMAQVEVAALVVLAAEAEVEAEDLVFMEEEYRNALVKFRKVVGELEVRVDAIVLVVTGQCQGRKGVIAPANLRKL
jgi:hypothetical protein